MEYRRLGKTGLKVSELCLGTMQFGWTADEKLSLEILTAAYNGGINFIDTADVYSRWAKGNAGGVSETIIGNWLKSSGIPRERVVIATKVRGQMGTGPNEEGLSRGHIMSAVESSLRRLGTDYIDLYQAHWFDEGTPIEETLKAFDDLIRQGKVRYIGCSNYPAWRLMQALWAADTFHTARYDSLQPHYNLVYRAEFERELMDICREYQLGVIPYSPLAGGFLTGKYRKGEPVPESNRASGVQIRYFNETGWQVLEAVEKIAQEYGKTPSQIAVAWQLTNPLITSPIIGPRTLDQLEDNFGAAHFRLPEDAKAILDDVSDYRKRGV